MLLDVKIIVLFCKGHGVKKQIFTKITLYHRCLQLLIVGLVCLYISVNLSMK